MDLIERDIRGMLRLVSSVAAMPAVGPSRCTRMLQGLSELTSAPIVLDVHLACGLDRQLCVTSACAMGLSDSQSIHIACHAADAVPDSHRTRVMNQISPMLARLQRAISGGVEQLPFLSSEGSPSSQTGHYTCSILRPAGAPMLHLLAAYRARQDAPFTAREPQIVHLLHEHVARLCHVKSESWESDLPPHLQRIIQELLAGQAEKQIAAKLGYTFNTVHQYVKLIYRKVGVSSRAELMARWLSPVEQRVRA